MATSITPMDEAKRSLIAMDSDFKAALPSHISVEKFRNVAITALTNTPDLLQCNKQTLWNSILKCAQDGLLPDGREAALVMFKSEVAYIPMVSGILKKVRNSGELATIDAQIVYEGDTYESWTDEKGPHFNHRKSLSDRGNPVLTYAYAITKDGDVYFEEISEDEMDKISKIAKTDKIWSGPFRNEMKRKSAIHRLSKRLPMNTDVQQVLDRDNQFYDLESAPQAPKPTTSGKLSEAILKQPPIETTATVIADPTLAPPDAVQTTVYELMYKSSKPEDKKQWKMCGVKIGNDIYSTFDDKIREKLEEAKAGHILINIHFKKEEKGEKTYFMITEISYPSVQQIQAPSSHDPRCTCAECMQKVGPV